MKKRFRSFWLSCVVLSLQDGLLRILSELLQDPKLGAGQAAEEFRDFGGEKE